MTYSRFAVYYLPEQPALAEFGARWLGYDCVTGAKCAAPEIAGLPLPLSAIIGKAHRYGFHATVMAPFHLANDRSLGDLETTFMTVCTALQTPVLDGLEVSRLGRFLALVALGDDAQLRAVAGHVVRGLNDFRAPLGAKDLQRRTPANATPRQQELLQTYGYLYVEEAYRFHITLTGRLGRDDILQVQNVLARELVPLLPRPFAIGALALVGEDEHGYFRLLRCAELKP
ncbi:MAG: DUF1045 domain-containing protein [Rhodobacterales bacterium]|nr:DUF1045 domain-containing protein [Rhodobacterales bacterium]